MPYKNTLLLLVFLSVLSSCKKDPKPADPELPVADPEMTYTNLNETVISLNQYYITDIDKNGKFDLLFRVEQVGSAISNEIRDEFKVESGLYCKLTFNANEEIPSLKKEDTITQGNMPGQEWYNLLSLTLFKKTSFYPANGVWSGNWKNASRLYIPFQLSKGGNIHLGWVEISADTVNERMILHRLALSVAPEKTIRAGK